MVLSLFTALYSTWISPKFAFQKLQKADLQNEDTFPPKLYLKVFFFLTATIYFALYSSPHNLRFHVEGVVGFCIKNLSRQWELAGLPVDKKMSSPHECFPTICSDTVTRHEDDWAEAEEGGGWTVKVWRWWKVPEVKTGWKAVIQSEPVDWPCPVSHSCFHQQLGYRFCVS